MNRHSTNTPKSSNTLNSPNTPKAVSQVLDFWFSADTQPFWFAKSEAFDTQIREQFGDTWQHASRGELAHWRATMLGRLAEVIVLDQFSRNLHRDQPQAFAQDGMALVLAQEAILLPEFEELEQGQQKFLLMPYMHSESAVIHEQAVALFEALGDAVTLEFEHKHKRIIERFGRYPHRNAVLGRTSTAEEVAFLKEAGSSF